MPSSLTIPLFLINSPAQAINKYATRFARVLFLPSLHTVQYYPYSLLPLLPFILRSFIPSVLLRSVSLSLSPPPSYPSLMAPQQPTPLPSSASAAQIVTVTVFSTSPSASTLPASSGGGGANVPIAAIAGGAAGGVTLAVILVLIWNYWGLVIKRTEKRRRKEAVRYTLDFRSISPFSPGFIRLCLY
jgi:hypothetical protein